MDNKTGDQILEEIMKSEPSVAYVKLEHEIARLEEEIRATRGWFWLSSKLSIPEKKAAEATIRLLKIARNQVAASISSTFTGDYDAATKNIHVTISKETISL